MSGWKPIETAPKDETPILLFYDFSPEEVSGIDLCEWDFEKELFFAVSPGAGYSCARAPGGYTHWMPLPGPPPNNTGGK